MKNTPAISWLIYSVLAWGMSGSVFAQTDEEDLALVYGDSSFVSIASGIKQPIERAPSVASVITAEDIASIGAADLDEVLETVPGIHVARSVAGYNPIYTIRGITTQFNPQVLVLINGIPITGIFVGNRSQVWGGMPVENISRIEVIRGPGSALYGADAFSGAINIITKTAAETKGTQLGVRVGSFTSSDAWVQYGGSVGAYDVAAYLRAGSTEGQREIIAVDALSATPFSTAPGPVSVGRNAIDGRIDLSREKWRLRAGYQQRDNGGSGAGVASALDAQGRSFGERMNADLTYENETLAPDLNVIAQLSYLSIVEKSDLFLFPAGTNFGLGAFPDGVQGNPDKWERHTRFKVTGTYAGLENHKLAFGIGTQQDELYRAEESRNYNLVGTPFGFFPAPLPGGLTDVSQTVPFITPHSRRVNYVYAQDEWALIPDWYLTAGVRHDRYSDFGSTTNPRIALVWEMAYNLTSKLLYGRAFRPPSFAELYNINNPVALGNANLQPEKNETYELAFIWQATGDVKANFNVYRYQMTDILRFVPDLTTGISTAQNAGRQNGQGVEIEVQWNAASNLRLSGNYAYQRSIDEFSNQAAGNSPQNQLYVRADWRFVPNWTVNTQFNYVGERKREPLDMRPEIADYQTVDVTLRTQTQASGWGYAFMLRNLFDADAREPSPAGIAGTLAPIPDDLPLARREWRVEVTYQF